MEKFNLQHQYELYLKNAGLSEKTMGEVQKQEMRRVFIGACGQMLVLLRDDLSELDEIKGVETMQDMLNQVSNFFLSENNKHN